MEGLEGERCSASTGNRAARQVRGLEGALVSRRPMTVRALATGDDRACQVSVAGPAALLVAKMHKLADRIDADDNRRINSKDAFDVFRLLQAVDAVELIDEINILTSAQVSAEVTAEAVAGFRELFRTPTGAGTVLVAEHVTGIEYRDVIVASSVALSEELLEGDGMTSPTAFITYSLDGEDHKAWVKDLATRLRKAGVDVTVDIWAVAPGGQLPEFMERGITDSDFVLVICTPGYKDRSDGRRGGVGYEGHIITSEIFARGNHEKFIPILRRGTWNDGESTDAAAAWIEGETLHRPVQRSIFGESVRRAG